MMTSRSLICLLENQNGGKLQKMCFYTLYITIVNETFATTLSTRSLLVT
jgi:hypothetical protein